MLENQNPNKRCVITIQERGTKGEGVSKTKIFVVKSENQVNLKELAKANIKNDAVVHADEVTEYDALHALYEMKRVNHQLHYMGDNGECTNQAESYFARFHRIHKGQVHKMSNQHLTSYANEYAYRKDTRRWSNGVLSLSTSLPAVQRSLFHGTGVATRETRLPSGWRPKRVTAENNRFPSRSPQSPLSVFVAGLRILRNP